MDADAVPVGLLHPALVGVGVLIAFVNNGATAQDFDSADVEEVKAAEYERAGGEINRVAGFWIEALAMNPGGDDGDARTGGWWRGRRRAGEEKEHLCVVEEVAGAGDGELGGSG